MSPKSVAAKWPEQDALFWRIADDLIGTHDIAEGTVFGYRCLRIGGEYLASVFSFDGALVLKLNRERADALIAEGVGLPFAPSGRPFKEWVTVPQMDETLWRDLLDEAIEIAEARSRASSALP